MHVCIKEYKICLCGSEQRIWDQHPPRTAQRYFKEGIAGESPKKKGPQVSSQTSFIHPCAKHLNHMLRSINAIENLDTMFAKFLMVN